MKRVLVYDALLYTSNRFINILNPRILVHTTGENTIYSINHDVPGTCLGYRYVHMYDTHQSFEALPSQEKIQKWTRALQVRSISYENTYSEYLTAIVVQYAWISCAYCFERGNDKRAGTSQQYSSGV